MKSLTTWLLTVLFGLLLVPGMADAAKGNGHKWGSPSPPDSVESDVAAIPFESEHFASAQECVNCHDNLRSDSGATVSLVEEWQASLMAFSFIDPLWQAKVRSEMLRLPDYATMIEAKCVKCHGPMAAKEAEYSNAEIKIFDGGFADPDNPFYALAREGVSCTLCHQIRDQYLGTEESFSGGFVVGSDTSSKRPLYAQIESPFTRSMRRSVGYTPSYGEHMHDAAVCATCHELLTPYVDLASGQLIEDPLFPEQTPYSEWLESSFSKDANFKTCHDCHLTHEPGVPAARAPRWLPSLEDFSRHTYYTENLVMLDLLEAFADELQIDASGLAESAVQGVAYLQGSASLEEESAALNENTLEVTLKVVNNTGHKLPTSIPIRRVYLHLTVTDAAGTIVFESGALDDKGAIVHGDADESPGSYEPHHDVITSEEQVQIYEGVMVNTLGDVTYTLLHASGYLKDNRVLPAGFNKTTADDRIQVYGMAKDDVSFTGGADLITYSISNMTGDAYIITAELRDQTIAYPFLTDLLEDSSADNEVGRFEAMYNDDEVEKDSGLIDTLQVDVTRK